MCGHESAGGTDGSLLIEYADFSPVYGVSGVHNILSHS